MQGSDKCGAQVRFMANVIVTENSSGLVQLSLPNSLFVNIKCEQQQGTAGMHAKLGIAPIARWNDDLTELSDNVRLC